MQINHNIDCYYLHIESFPGSPHLGGGEPGNEGNVEKYYSVSVPDTLQGYSVVECLGDLKPELEIVI